MVPGLKSELSASSCKRHAAGPTGRPSWSLTVGATPIFAALLAVTALSPWHVPAVAAARDTGWPVYGGNAEGQRYSALRQLDPSNVGQLRQVWRFDAGTQGGLQTNPLVIGRTLFGYTSDQAAFALDAATGKLLWRFETGQTSGQPARGMSWWEGAGKPRLFVSNVNFLYALDPATGRPITSFGSKGRIDLREDLGRDAGRNAVFATSPGIVYRDLLILGFRTSENAPAAPGDIRAYDVRTGRLRWVFHTIPHPGEAGHESWPANAWKTAGAANNWAGMALDPARGIVYVPTGSAVFDFYGGDRSGDNLYANSLLALDARTGKRLWHFQAVHHDIWDRDFPSPPSLLTVVHDAKRVDAVAQTTKQGFVYLFNRVTGKPLFPVEERPVPRSDVPGEVAAPTQPFPTKPAPFARQQLTEEMLNRRTPEAHAAVVEKFRTMRGAGQFVPLALDRNTIIFPGFDGGAEWGGAAVDRAAGVLYVNANDVPWFTRLLPNAAAPKASRGQQVYQSNCSGCHGSDRKGSPPEVPALDGVASRMLPREIGATIVAGKGRMPGFPQIAEGDLSALISFLASNGSEGTGRQELLSAAPAATGAPYLAGGYNKFQDPDGYPAVVPPWGTLNAIDLNSGAYLWRVPLGEYPELVAKGVRDTGSENYGGPIVTASHLLFIGATIFDRKFRAFDSRTGQLLWETELPFSGTATPSTYSVDGRQYVVIATSGARDRKGPQGAAYVAFALPARP